MGSSSSRMRRRAEAALGREALHRPLIRRPTVTLTTRPRPVPQKDVLRMRDAAERVSARVAPVEGGPDWTDPSTVAFYDGSLESFREVLLARGISSLEPVEIAGRRGLASESFCYMPYRAGRADGVVVGLRETLELLFACQDRARGEPGGGERPELDPHAWTMTVGAAERASD
jgi:hypothetical protein